MNTTQATETRYGIRVARELVIGSDCAENHHAARRGDWKRWIRECA